MFCQIAQAQTTEFSYQGSLKDGANSANGNHDFEFALFDAVSGGSQLGSTITLTNITVTNGVFAVQLNFGGNFTGTNRFLEIRVRQSGGGAFTTLNPRQIVTSSPYSIRSLNATTADTATTATNATNFSGNLSGDVSGTQSATVINTVGGQSAANVASATQSINTATSANTPNTLVRRNANGDFSANIISAARYNIGGSRVLSVPGVQNTFVGINAGTALTSGDSNSFFGNFAGFTNTFGGSNSFFGYLAGFSNNGFSNSFFGVAAGDENTTGSFNSFVGAFAGTSNTTGRENSFVGAFAGHRNTTGFNNSFVGNIAGGNNTTGSNNTIIGNLANVGSSDLTFATALGSGAVVNTSNTIVLGRSADTVLAPNLLQVNVLGAAGSTSLCRNALNQISTCIPGHLPEKGSNENAATLTALREQLKQQQELLDKQQSEIKRQQVEFDALKKFVCLQNPTAELCHSEPCGARFSPALRAVANTCCSNFSRLDHARRSPWWAIWA